MQPHEVELLTMVMMLLGAMTVSATISAYTFRNLFSCGFILAAFVATIAMIIITAMFHQTNNPLIAFGLAIGLGATIGADLGGFVIAVTKGKKRGAEAVFVTLAIMAVMTVCAALIGLLSGYNFQGIGGIMFVVLLGIVGLSTIMIFVKFNKITEMIIGGAVSAFFFVYMIYDFNQIVDKFDDATWGNAIQVSLGIFLDLVNIFVRLLPIIVEIMDAMD